MIFPICPKKAFTDLTGLKYNISIASQNIYNKSKPFQVRKAIYQHAH